MFDDKHNGFSIRLTDLGFSSLLGGKIRIHGTKGWVAPEWHHREFSTNAEGAKKMEIFSIGLVVRWILFGGLQDVREAGADPYVWAPFLSARQSTLGEGQFDALQKENLLQVFDQTLNPDPCERTSDCGTVLQLLRPERFNVLCPYSMAYLIFLRLPKPAKDAAKEVTTARSTFYVRLYRNRGTSLMLVADL